MIGRPKVKEKRIQRTVLLANEQEVKLIKDNIIKISIAIGKTKGISVAEYIRYMAIFIPREYLIQEKITSTQRRLPRWSISTTTTEYEIIKDKALENELTLNEYLVRASLSNFNKVNWDFIKNRK